MTKFPRALALIAVLALPVGPGCRNPGDPDEEFDPPTSEELAISIDPHYFEFTHVVGQSPCPQLIGRVTIRNNGTSPFTTDIRARNPVPLSFGFDQTVQPGGTATIEVFFTCASQQSFRVTVDTLRENPGQQASELLPPGSFNVVGNIVR
jgi:hypothetical protein